MKSLTSLVTLLIFFSSSATAKDAFMDMHDFNPELGTIDSSHSSLNADFSNEVIQLGVTQKLLMYRDNMGSTRGAKEVGIFKKAAMGTVLIATDSGVGSGAIITNNGYIVTNQHVVEGKKKVTVFFKPLGLDYDLTKLESTEGTVEKVSIKKDLALVKIDRIPSSARPLALAGESLPDIGSDAHAIGHPKGELWTYTRGYVSQVRVGYLWDYQGGNGKRSATVIQTQTPINPGNSGGPLLDEAGNLIGINSFVDSKAEGLNYAIAAPSIREFLQADRSALERENKQFDSAKNGSNGQSKCGKEVVRQVRDRNDWLGDFTRQDYDPDCVGRITVSFSYPDASDKPNIIALEHDEKLGVIGILLVDEGQDKVIDYTLVDVDGDGDFDLWGENKPGEFIASDLRETDQQARR